MALSRRGKRIVGASAVLAVAGAGTLAWFGKAPGPIQAAVDTITGRTPRPTCPLTGQPTGDGEEAAIRPLLAIKVENTTDAYPLSGLNKADMVYEEVVEGGITRFVALFHCDGSQRVGPVRSARTTDPKILVQFQQEPLLGYSGGAPKVVRSLDDAGAVQLTESSTPKAFTRDGAREAPHNLFTSTGPLWKAGEAALERPATPRAVFSFEEDVPDVAKPAGSVDIVFSTLSRTGWRWEGRHWVRLLDGEPFLLEEGAPVTADNIVIQQVEVTMDTIVDASGTHSPVLTMTGTGKAWVLRDGKAIYGTWERETEDDLTVFRTRDGDEIELAPGATWVELVPTDGKVTIATK